MSRFFSKRFKTLVPYTPGEQPLDMEYIKLNTNESPYDTPHKASEMAVLEAFKLRLYPDPGCRELTRTAADYFGIDKDMIMFSNGSDESLYLAVMAYCDEKTGAAFPDITYSFYPVICELNNIAQTLIPLRDDMTIDTDDYINLKKTILIANPNAPTGIALKKKEIEEIVSYNPENIVIVDEAYVDFGTESAIYLTEKYDNVLVSQTFSKSRGMAGARLGFMIGQKELINDLKTLKDSINPYNINRMTMAAGIGALLDDDYVEANCTRIINTRQRTEKALRDMGFKTTDSKANFVFATKPGTDGRRLYEELKSRGILVRHFDHPRIKDFIRITVGTDEQMDVFLREIKDISGNII